MKNNIRIGLGLGAIFPLIAHILFVFTAIEQHFLPDKPMALYTIAVLINLVMLRFAYRSGKDQVGKGIIIITFLAMILYLIKNKITQ